MHQRIQKVLAQWGVASRRQAEQLIRSGRITVNGRMANIGEKIDPFNDSILYDGKRIQGQRRELLYILLNKPLGVISTCFDPQGRPTVLDYLPTEISLGKGLHPVGRLDMDSTGALLLTNDGNLTLKLTHPRYHLHKTYHVWVEGYPLDSLLNHWRQGLQLDGKLTLPAEIKVLKRKKGQTLLEIILSEGRNRQIRNCADILGHPVVKLNRIAIGPILLNSPGRPELILGSYRILDDSESELLKNHLDTTAQKLSLSCFNQI